MKNNNAETAQTMRWYEGPRSLQWVAGLVFLVITVYFGVMATDRYMSESIVAVKRTGGHDTGLFSLGILTGDNPLAREDSQFLVEYILSLDMMSYLDKTLGLREAYSSEAIDLFSRLASDATQEEFLEYYRNHITVRYNTLTSALTIQTQGFNPEYSARLNSAILTQCEKFLNDVSHNIAREQIQFISGELERSEGELLGAKKRILSFQEKNRVLDPVEEARAKAGSIAQLEAELVRHEAELKNMLTFLTEDAGQIVSLRSKISGLREQISDEKKKLSGDSASHLADVASQFKMLEFELEFATERHKTTLASLEKARADASNKLKYLVTLSSPHVPEEAEYPRRAYVIGGSFVGILLIYGLLRLVVATIQDHKD